MKKLLKLFIVLTYATSLQAGGKYVPEQQKDERQNTQQTLPHLARRERRAAKSLRHRRSGREIQAQDPAQPLHKAKNLVRRPQKRALGAARSLLERAPRRACVHGREMPMGRARKGATGGF